METPIESPYGPYEFTAVPTAVPTTVPTVPTVPTAPYSPYSPYSSRRRKGAGCLCGARKPA